MSDLLREGPTELLSGQSEGRFAMNEVKERSNANTVRG